MSDRHSDTSTPREPTIVIGLGEIGMLLHLYASPGHELRAVVTPPWPSWIRDLYAVEAATDAEIDVDAGEVSLGAAVTALTERLSHRLELIAFLCSALTDLGWTLRLDGDSVLATTTAPPQFARERLDAAGVAGGLCKVCDLDEAGWPRFIRHGEVEP